MEQSTHARTGIQAAEFESRRERLLEHVRREGLSGYVLFDEHYIRYFTGFGFLSTERPVVFAQSAARRDGRARARVRGRARARRDRLRARRVVPGVPGDRAPDAHPRARARRPRHPRRDRRRPGRLSRDPRLPGPCAERGGGEHGEPALGRDREHDGAQERRPRSRSSARARAGASTRTGCCRSTRGPARPRPRRVSARGTRRRSRCCRRSARSAGRPRPTACRPATAGRSACAARGRTRSRTTSSSSRATCSSARRARRSGATTPSSSAP